MIQLKKILLVEDNPNDVELTLEALSEQNLTNRVIVLNDGVKAMEYLLYDEKYESRERENPAVILLDIKMPRMDGIEVLQAIKNNRELKTIPVVMLTSSREEPDLKKCYELGVNAYVVKPVNYKDFFEAVKRLGIFWAMLNELPLNGGPVNEK
ncbi:MAG TPA: two-component system response regulator [Prolixibacteraceae bacterium]|jgi:CheY-like chemotaxis protein|nr:two-component system response regulator [Prolixibacteraceae bacterium]